MGSPGWALPGGFVDVGQVGREVEGEIFGGEGRPVVEGFGQAQNQAGHGDQGIELLFLDVSP